MRASRISPLTSRRARSPRNPPSFVALAWVALRNGQPSVAAEWYEAAFTEAPGFAEGEHLGRAAHAAMAASIMKGGPALDEPARTKWRLRALEWLEAQVEPSESCATGAGSMTCVASSFL